jgi:hypothetical protein
MIYKLKIPGRIGVGESVNRTFTVTSTGPIDLVISTIGIYPVGVAAFSLENDNCAGQTLARDQNCTFQVVFTPDSVGDKEADLVIPSNSVTKPEVIIALSGTGILLCQCDLEPEGGDKDVDGADLAAYIADSGEITVAEFAGEYGSTDCP